MDNSYNVIRRFTPPTCTLEIWGKNSPLSRWTNKKVFKDIQFKLSFDDPKNLDTEPVTIKGDRDKLEQLYRTVLDYTGNFLERSFNPKSLSLVTNDEKVADSDRPYLTSQGLVNHQLNLGSLANDEQETIDLSATQLYDLVSALEEYQTEMAAIAKLEAQQSKKSRPWLPIGASVAGILLAVGVVTVIRTNERSPEEIATTQEPTPVTPQPEVVPPEAPEVAEKPAVEAEKNDPLSSTEILPPPPAVDTPKPPPNIPDPAKYPPSGNLTIPPVTELPQQDEVTLNPTEATPEAELPDDSQVESTINVPPETETETESKAESENATESDTQESIASPTENNEAESLENIEEAQIAISDDNRAIDPDLVERSQESAFNQEATEYNLEENPALSDRIANNNTAKPTTEGATTTEDEAESKISQLRQLAEIESYFRQKWQIPAELKQTLEYRLILGSDGSIERIIPLGKAAEIYVDRTNIPLMGEPFVSPLDCDRATVRLLLSPDGEVKTFLE